MPFLSNGDGEALLEADQPFHLPVGLFDVDAVDLLVISAETIEKLINFLQGSGMLCLDGLPVSGKDVLLFVASQLVKVVVDLVLVSETP